MSYETYSVEDFAADEFFQQWVRAPDAEINAFWQSFLVAHPEKSKTVEEARLIVKEIDFAELRMPESMSRVIWQNVSEAVNQEEIAQTPYKQGRRNWVLPLWTRWAAVLTGCLLLSVIYLYQLVEFTAGHEKLTRRTINPNLYTAWKDHKLILDNTSLGEVLQMLEETYGLQPETVSPALLNLKVSGSIPVTDQESLLEMIGEAYGVTIRQNEKSIAISQ